MKQCVVHRIISLRKNEILSIKKPNIYKIFVFREIASRTPHGFATDVWSLGILIVTLLTGHPPFETDSTCRKTYLMIFVY
jgi:serine/threonine protein kinase